MHRDPSVSSQVSQQVRVMVADPNLMSAQMLGQFLSRDPRFRVTVVSTTSQMMAEAARCDVGVVSADLGDSLDETMRGISSFSERHPCVRLILLIGAPSRDLVVDAFRCGARGVFSRQQPIEDFLKCVDRVNSGEIWASRAEIDHLLSALRSTPTSRMIVSGKTDALSKRELEVVRLAGEGLANKEIAERLGLSEHTVKNYLFRTFEKIGVSSRVELLFYLLRREKSAEGDDATGGGEELPEHYTAAQNGAVNAQFKLGAAHYGGSGAKRDVVSAYYWLTLAHKNAEEVLDKSGQVLERLRKSMTVEDIQEAERSLASGILRGVRTLPRQAQNGKACYALDRLPN